MGSLIVGVILGLVCIAGFLYAPILGVLFIVILAGMAAKGGMKGLLTGVIVSAVAGAVIKYLPDNIAIWDDVLNGAHPAGGDQSFLYLMAGPFLGTQLDSFTSIVNTVGGYYWATIIVFAIVGAVGGLIGGLIRKE